MIETLQLFLADAVASQWLLLVIVALAVVDALLPVVPSEALIIAAGVGAAAGQQSLVAVIAAAGAGAFVGESASYLIGRGVGPACRRRLAPGSARAALFDRVGDTLAARGGTILLTARYLPGGRTVATLAAGATRFPVAPFVAFSALGALMSAAYVAVLGFVGGTAFAQDTLVALLFSLGLGLVITAGLGLRRRVCAGATAA